MKIIVKFFFFIMLALSLSSCQKKSKEYDDQVILEFAIKLEEEQLQYKHQNEKESLKETQSNFSK